MSGQDQHSDTSTQNLRNEYYLSVNMLKGQEKHLSNYIEEVNRIEYKYAKIILDENLAEHLIFPYDWLNNKNIQKQIFESVKSEKLDSSFLNVNFSNILNTLIFKGEFTLVNKFDNFVSDRYQNIIKEIDCRVKTSLDSIKAYVEYLDHLKATNIREDTLEIMRILKLQSVYQSGIFCHEGCGGCNLSLFKEELLKFKSKFRNFKDVVDFKLLDLELNYEEEETKEMRIIIEKTVWKYPSSSLVVPWLIWLIHHEYNNYLAEGNTFTKARFNKNLNQLLILTKNTKEVENLLKMQKELNEKEF